MHDGTDGAPATEPARPIRRGALARVLWVSSVPAVVALEGLRLPVGVLPGAMLAAILVASLDAGLQVPRWPFVLAQGLGSCLMARSVGPAIVSTMVQQWPVFLAGVCVVLLFSTSLGVLLARWHVLPGTTAVWGSAPGAATVRC